MALGQEMLLALNRAMPDGESVRLMAIIRLFSDGRTGLGLQVGQERMYAVKSIYEFLNCYNQGTPVELSPKFTYRPAQMRFSKEEEAVLLMLQSHMPPKAEEDETPARPQSEGRFVLLIRRVFAERHALFRAPSVLPDARRRAQAPVEHPHGGDSAVLQRVDGRGNPLRYGAGRGGRCRSSRLTGAMF